MAVYNKPFGWTLAEVMGDTPLLAAMRCYVSWRLAPGNVILVAHELLRRQRSVATRRRWTWASLAGGRGGAAVIGAELVEQHVA